MMNQEGHRENWLYNFWLHLNSRTLQAQCFSGLNSEHSLLMTISCWSRRFPLKNPSNLIPQSSLDVSRPPHLLQWALRGQSSWRIAVKARRCWEVLRKQHGKRFFTDSPVWVIRTLFNCLQHETLLVPKFQSFSESTLLQCLRERAETEDIETAKWLKRDTRGGH